MPAIGLGTWKADPGVVGAAVQSALHMGYRHIDCAYIYGNEAEIGSALSTVFAADTSSTSIPRKDVFITSKLWNTEHAPAAVEPALRQSLQNLQLDYLDLYLMHWPVAMTVDEEDPTKNTVFGSKMQSLEERPLLDTWKAMEALVDKGLVKDIGVSNFSKHKLQALIDKCRIRPSVNQVELHPYLQQTKELKDFCDQEGIHLTAYSPLGSSDRAPSMKGANEIPILEDATIAAVAKKHQATPAQVLIAWAVQRGTSAIPKSVSPERQLQNLESIKVQLDEEDMEQIRQLDANARYVDGSFWCQGDSPYTLENLWDAEKAAQLGEPSGGKKEEL